MDMFIGAIIGAELDSIGRKKYTLNYKQQGGTPPPSTKRRVEK